MCSVDIKKEWMMEKRILLKFIQMRRKYKEYQRVILGIVQMRKLFSIKSSMDQEIFRLIKNKWDDIKLTHHNKDQHPGQ